jgi:hypothetical protein
MCKILRFPIERAVPGRWCGAAEEEYCVCVQCETPLEIDWQPDKFVPEPCLFGPTPHDWSQPDMFVELALDKLGLPPQRPADSEPRYWCDNCQEYTALTHIYNRMLRG